jgi:hypothetical protein
MTGSAASLRRRHGAVTPSRCEDCGERLPESGPGSRLMARLRGIPAIRADARYCSNACRQRAYRRRRRSSVELGTFVTLAVPATGSVSPAALDADRHEAARPLSASMPAEPRGSVPAPPPSPPSASGSTRTPRVRGASS